MSEAPTTQKIDWSGDGDTRLAAVFDEALPANPSDCAVALLGGTYRLKNPKSAAGFLAGLGWTSELQTGALLVTALNVHPAWYPACGEQTSFAIQVLLVAFERLNRVNGKRPERRRRLGEFMMDLEKFCTLFCSEVPDGSVGGLMEELREAEKARREAWEKHVAAQPPPVPMPSATVIQTIAKALAQIQQPGATP